MQIYSIEMKNFRCFFGTQRIDFSTDAEKNITLIHAQNGVGKTTLLNSILWCFYEKVSKGFEKPNNIINEEALKKNKFASASVQISFEHKGKQYDVFRSIRPDSRTSDLKIQMIEDDGNMRPLPEAGTKFMESIIPYDMARYFFFDGENATAFGSTENKDEVSEAIKNILGCHLLDRTLDDLQKVEKVYNRQIATNTVNLDTQMASNKIASNESEILDLEGKLVQNRKNLQYAKEEEQKKAKELQSLKASAELAKRRSEYEYDLYRHKRKLEELKISETEWIEENGISLVAKGISDMAFDFLEDLRKKGTIPSPYNETFVKDLLEHFVERDGKRVHECICGRTFEDGDEAFRHILSLKELATPLELEHNLTKVKSRIDALKREAVRAPQALKRIENDILEKNEEIKKCEREIAEIGKQLKDNPEERVKQLEAARNEWLSKRDECVRNDANLNNKINRLNEENASLQQKIDSAERSAVRSRLFMKKRDLTKLIYNKLRDLSNEDQKTAIKVISHKINEILQGIMRKNVKVSISSDFKIDMAIDGTDLGRSNGEKQLLSLAFISALVWFAKIRENATSQYLLPGTIAPLVLDSPFGQLDDSYKPQTANFIPEMASQVVLLVSGSQGDASVMRYIEKHVGAEYILVRENTGERGSKPVDEIKINGEIYEQTRYNSNFNGTSVEEITLGETL